MRRLLGLIFSLLIIPTSVSDGSQLYGPAIHAGFLKAGEYLEMPDEGRRAYARGLLDGFYMAPMFGAPEDSKWLIPICECVEGMKASQVAAIIDKFIKDHPEHWHWDADEQGYKAMREACHVRAFPPTSPKH